MELMELTGDRKKKKDKIDLEASELPGNPKVLI